MEREIGEMDDDDDEDQEGNASVVTCGTWTPDDQQIYLGTDR